MSWAGRAFKHRRIGKVTGSRDAKKVVNGISEDCTDEAEGTWEVHRRRYGQPE